MANRKPAKRSASTIVIPKEDLKILDTSVIIDGRIADIAETGNVQIQVIVKPAVVATMLERLHRELFAAYAMVAYESEVRVMRPEKF